MYGCQNVHPGYAFNMEFKRLKRDFFLSIIHLFFPRGIKVGSAVFSQGKKRRSDRKPVALILMGELTIVAFTF